MSLTVRYLYRYPVKGLSGEALQTADLAPGEPIPHDRRYAIAHGSTQFDPASPQHLPKTNFLMLMRNERLARLRADYDPASTILTVSRDGRPVARGALDNALGRSLIEQFFAAFMGEEVRGAPRIVASPGHSFSDHRHKVLSLVNLASVRDLERVTRAPVDHRRFRANLYFDGGEAWREFDWIGREIVIGRARLSVTARIDRCAAVNVDPETGLRDMNLPRALQSGFGHVDMGVYAAVVSGGSIAVGDSIAAPISSA